MTPKDKEIAEKLEATRGPHYRVDYKLHLPKHEGWRPENRTYRRIIESDNPEGLFYSFLHELILTLGFGTNEQLWAGLMMNLINSKSDELRTAIASGIIEGMGLELTPDAGELIGSFVQRFTNLPIDREKQTPSGLILPSGELA